MPCDGPEVRYAGGTGRYVTRLLLASLGAALCAAGVRLLGGWGEVIVVAARALVRSVGMVCGVCMPHLCPLGKLDYSAHFLLLDY